MISILLDRTEITAPLRLRIELTTGIQADTFDFTIPNIGGQYSSLFLDTQGRTLTVAIDGPTTFTGICDEFEPETLPKPQLTLRGRDNTAILIDETITDTLARKLAGRTASRIVETVAAQFGFTADTEPTTKVWSDAGAFPAGSSVWSALVGLAQKEAFDLYVTPDKTIIFKKRALPTDTIRTWTVPAPTGPVGSGPVPLELSIHQAKTLALALKVKVTGYDQARNRKIVFTAESRLRNRPNYKLIELVDHSLSTRALVRARAETALVEISKNLLTGRLLVPVDPQVRPGHAIQLRFAGKQDQTFAGRYFVTTAIHNLDDTGEFTTEIHFASRPLVDARDMQVDEL